MRVWLLAIVAATAVFEADAWAFSAGIISRPSLAGFPPVLSLLFPPSKVPLQTVPCLQERMQT
jgi:hypothetical protein